MTDNFNSSSFDPSMRDDLSGTMRYVLTKWLQNTDDMLPAKVIAYDRTLNRASVQALISVVTTNNTIVQRPVIASIPVLQLGGGGFVLSFPIQSGDIGWIKASDRDISLFLQSIKSSGGVISPPNTVRKHSFEDAMFIPDTMFKTVTIAGEDANHVVLQSLDGTTKIAMGNGTIKILAPTSMSITTPTLTVNGEVVATGNVTGQGTSLHTHVHSGVTTGGGNTGSPV